MFSEENVKSAIKSTERVLIAAITARSLIPLAVCVAICVCAWQLSGDAIERLLTLFFTSLWFAIAGWALLALLLAGGWQLFRWRERLHQAQVLGLTEDRDKWREAQLKLMLEKPIYKLENPQEK